AGWLAADRARGFDLEHAPLMRLTLIRVASDTYRFVWSHHHILLDGWSLPLVFSEVISGYEALHYGAHLPVRSPARPYRDYIAWLCRADMARAEAYWRE